MDNYDLEAKYAEQKDVTEEFEPVVMFPMVAYHGSLKSLWGVYYISNSRDSSGLVLEALGAAVMAEDRPPTLRRVSRSSVTMTGKFWNPATGEIR